MVRRWSMLLAVVAAALPGSLFGQYYDWGASPASIRWESISSPRVKVIGPADCAPLARRALFFADTVRHGASFGYRHGTMPTPVILHTQNFVSNGMVMWAPRRVEFITVPDGESYAIPWLKHLAAHEFRHNVQYNNLSRHFFRGLNILLGEQASFLSLAFMPVWALEGDAVQAETQMTTYGRGRQPSFNIEYRALGSLAGRRWQEDKWFCGSYRTEVPDHYKLGYQICAWSYDRYGCVVWDDVADYASRYPFTIFAKNIVLKKCYDTSVSGMFRDTFDSLSRFWASLPRVENTMRRIVTPETSYTTYRYPLIESDSTLLAVKSDLDRPSRIVRVNRTSGREETLAMIGRIDTPPTVAGGRMVWTEYRSRMFWPQRVDSQLVEMELSGGRPRKVKGMNRVLYPVALPDGELAYVEYDYGGSYTIVRGTLRVQDPEACSIHGLACDDVTGRLCYIGLCDEGMYIGEVEAGGSVRRLTQPSYSSLRTLRAGGGRLYFGSIASGRDEVNMLDLATLVQRRITGSEFGSFDPGPQIPGSGASADRIALTVYDRDGYHLAMQEFAPDTLERVEWAAAPPDVVNPRHRAWDVMNIDTVHFTMQTDSLMAREHEPRRFRKVPHLVKVHSWAPAQFDPIDLNASEVLQNLHAGVTLLSQDLLSSTTAIASVGYRGDAPKGYRTNLYARIIYNGLAPKMELSVNWGGYSQSVYRTSVDPRPARLRNGLEVAGSIYLPLFWDRGYWYRYLTPRVEWRYTNTLIYEGTHGSYPGPAWWGGVMIPGEGSFRCGVNRMVFSLQYSEQARKARRDFLPRWGWSVRVYGVEALDRDFGNLYGVTGTVYTPGVLPHNSVMVRGAWQYSGRKSYNFKMKEVFPRGAEYDFSTRRYAAVSADYQLPLCYPDWGIPSILYIKRIRLDAGFDYASYLPGDRSAELWKSLWSAGGSLIFDFNPLRTPDSATATFTVSCFKPSDRRGVYLSMGVSLPL